MHLMPCFYRPWPLAFDGRAASRWSFFCQRIYTADRAQSGLRVHLRPHPPLARRPLPRRRRVRIRHDTGDRREQRLLQTRLEGPAVNPRERSAMESVRRAPVLCVVCRIFTLLQI